MAKPLAKEVINRLYKNVFVCHKCKRRIRANPQKIMQKKIVCRYCKASRSFRPVSKGRKK